MARYQKHPKQLFFHGCVCRSKHDPARIRRFQLWVTGVLQSFSAVNAMICAHTHLHFLFQMLGSFYWGLLGLFWIVLRKFYTEEKKYIRRYTSHNSAPQYYAEETQAFSVQFRESSIYLISCSPSLLECNPTCVNFPTRLHLELRRSDIIFNYVTGK